jgi:hypothetical protein
MIMTLDVRILEYESIVTTTHTSKAESGVGAPGPPPPSSIPDWDSSISSVVMMNIESFYTLKKFAPSISKSVDGDRRRGIVLQG